MTRLLLLAAALLLVGACSSSGDSGRFKDQITDCTRRSFLLTTVWFDRVGAIVDVITGGEGQAGIEVLPSSSPSDPPHTWIVSAEFSSNGVGEPDTTLSGRLSFSADPGDGITSGDSAAVDVTVSGATSRLTGALTGTLTFESATTATWVGTASGGNRDLGCDGTFLSDATAPLVIELAGLAGSRLAAQVFELNVFGTVDANVVSLGNRLEGELELSRTSQLVTVDGTINGQRIDVYTFELFPSGPAIDGLVACTLAHLDAFGVVFERTADVVAAIDDPGSYPDVTLTQTAFSSWRFSVRIDGFDNAYTGSITLPLQPGSVGSLVWTARLDGGAITGGSETPLYVVSPGGTSPGATPGRLWGGGRFESGGPICETAFHIPQDQAIEFDAAGDVVGGGRMSLDTAQDGHLLGIVVDFSSGEAELVRVTLDGLPVPPDRIGLGG